MAVQDHPRPISVRIKTATAIGDQPLSYLPHF